MGGFAGILSAILAAQQVLLPQLPRGIVELLDNNFVITDEVLDHLNVDNLSYTLIGLMPVVAQSITGGIIAGEHEILARQVMVLERQPGWMARSYIVVVTDMVDTKLLKELWAGKVAYVIFYTTSIYVYNPFKDDLVAVEDDRKLENVLKEIWTDLNGYPTVVDIYRHQLGFLEGFDVSLGAGVDASALYELTNYWNMTVTYTPAKNSVFQTELANKHLIAGKCDLSMNARFMMTAGEGEYLDYTSTIFADSVGVVLKNAPKLRGWDVFAKIYRWEVWVAIVTMIMLLIGVFIAILDKKDPRQIILLVLRCVFSIPMKTPKCPKQRAFLGPTMLCSTVILSLYIASLYNITESGHNLPQFDTLESFGRSGMPIFAMRHGMGDYFEMRKAPNIKNIGRRVEVTKDISDDILEHSAYVMREKEMKLLLETNSIRRDVYFINEKVLSYTMAYVVKHGSPFYEPLSDFTSRIFESGLYEKWYSLTVDRVMEATDRKQTVYKNIPTRRPLTISDIEVAFFVLLVGQGISLGVFLLEIAVNFFVRRKDKKKKIEEKLQQNQHKPIIPYVK